MTNTTDNKHDAHEGKTADEAWQKLTPAADTTMNVRTKDAKAAPSVRERSPQSATGRPAPDASQGNAGGGMAGRGGASTATHNNDLPHGMSADIPDDALGGTIAQGAAAPGTANRDRHDREPNPDATDTASMDEGWQRIRNP